MLGSRAAGELAGGALVLESAGTALGARRIAAGAAAWTALWTAVEDGLAALNSLACCVGVGHWRSGRWRRWRGFVDGARPGLGHDHFAHLNHRSGGRDYWNFWTGSGRNFLCLSAHLAATVVRGWACCDHGGRVRNSGRGRLGDGDRRRRCDGLGCFYRDRGRCGDCFRVGRVGLGWWRRDDCSWQCSGTCRRRRRHGRLDHDCDGRGRNSDRGTGRGCSRGSANWRLGDYGA